MPHRLSEQTLPKPSHLAPPSLIDGQDAPLSANRNDRRLPLRPPRPATRLKAAAPYMFPPDNRASPCRRDISPPQHNPSERRPGDVARAHGPAYLTEQNKPFPEPSAETEFKPNRPKPPPRHLPRPTGELRPSRLSHPYPSPYHALPPEAQHAHSRAGSHHLTILAPPTEPK